MGWWVLLAMASIAVARGKVAESAVYFVLGLAACYVVSLQLHPRSICRGCGGTGRHRGAMFWWADRSCTVCAGGSRHRRRGVQVFHGKPGKQVWAERAAARARARKGAPR